MVVIDQLRISDNGKQLHIDVHVNTATVYSGFTLKSLTIMTSSQVSDDHPYCAPNDSASYIYKKIFEQGVTEAHLVLPDEDVSNFNDGKGLPEDLLFVYIECQNGGQTDPCFELLTCEQQELTTLGVVFDENLLHQKVMQYTKGLASSCSVPVEFRDFILLWNAFKASVETEHYIPAIKFYNMLFGKSDSNESRDGRHSPYGTATGSVTSRPCNCNG